MDCPNCKTYNPEDRTVCWRCDKPLPRPFRKLTDGEELVLGGCRVKAIATPGHTPGSMAYLLDGRYLFTGDTLGFSKGTAKPYFIGMDKRGQAASIAKLADLQGIDWLCTGHSGWRDDCAAVMGKWR